jgi:general secretion pathway protein G
MIEIMLVLALIGLITGTVVVGLRKRARNGQIQIATMKVRELSGTLFQYRVSSNGDCPPSSSSDDAARAGDKDPWGHPYVIVCPGVHDQESADVVSLGPDGQPGNDDIESWKLQQ